MTRVLISGAGIGGLALAQALRRGGLDVAVHEQDPTPQTRGQGYRLHIDPNGNAALRACLPPEVLDLVRRTSGVNGDLVATYTQHLVRVYGQEFPGIPADEITNVDRETLRRGLLTGLSENVTFGRTVTGYRITGAGRVRVEFADGGGDEGDLLVGADGVGSAVRRKLIPHAAPRDLGLRCVYGRMPIDATTEPLIPADFSRGFCWVAGENGYGVGFAPVRFRDRSGGYLMIALVTAAEALPGDLLGVVLEATADWHPAIKTLLSYADSTSFFPITIRASDRVDPWPSGPVTLLGDAIHTMPPAGGVGANTALQDAATLAAELLSGKPVLEAVAAYERVMIPRGFDTVENSLRMIGQMIR
ncbi:FAD-dependent oxidoreductase [Actinoplanes regularis]|uniref:2-polyprenyl-6-methoxyphenol hydroxylase n=1 Tax=Actinoplanes regularis TaxID=52697 RepID=A0A239DW33_9ACTN|nr:NAD(P)/FAD-dependent oxidoreductase [Actinoplanes regularis]GIE89005.1 FAD-dependent oxidoreductase [Actinoplanes regularis]SNS35933.1 2-polyprenyl-6-methoxyphenol hydroxylase [Actinoplanes regularis]